MTKNMARILPKHAGVRSVSNLFILRLHGVLTRDSRRPSGARCLSSRPKYGNRHSEDVEGVGSSMPPPRSDDAAVDSAVPPHFLFAKRPVLSVVNWFIVLLFP